MSTNLIERLENLLHALNEARDQAELLDVNGDSAHAVSRIDDASGIACEVLSMIDGR